MNRPHASTIDLSISGAPLMDEQGSVQRLVFSFEDITERRERERQLNLKNEQLEVLNRVVRHDIRNDMAVVIGWLETVQDEVAPGFVWDADIEVFPRVSVRVVDAYEFGDGSLRAMLLSTLSVAEAEPSPAMNESELQRYLGEAVWFPTALLPSADVEWDSIDDQSARATIEDQGNRASLVFHFDDEGLVKQVTSQERYRQETDDFVPWTGYFEDYEWHDGMRIPTTAAVEWNSRLAITTPVTAVSFAVASPIEAHRTVHNDEAPATLPRDRSGPAHRSRDRRSSIVLASGNYDGPIRVE